MPYKGKNKKDWKQSLEAIKPRSDSRAGGDFVEVVADEVKLATSVELIQPIYLSEETSKKVEQMEVGLMPVEGEVVVLAQQPHTPKKFNFPDFFSAIEGGLTAKPLEKKSAPDFVSLFDRMAASCKQATYGVW